MRFLTANSKIREKLFQHHISLWQVGAEIGVSENTILRWFRRELDPTHKEVIENAIATIIERRAENE